MSAARLLMHTEGERLMPDITESLFRNRSTISCIAVILAHIPEELLHCLIIGLCVDRRFESAVDRYVRIHIFLTVYIRHCEGTNLSVLLLKYCCSFQNILIKNLSISIRNNFFSALHSSFTTKNHREKSSKNSSQ